MRIFKLFNFRLINIINKVEINELIKHTFNILLNKKKSNKCQLKAQKTSKAS